MNKKFLLWINLSLFHFCFAYYFQKEYDCELYALIDTTDRPKKFFEDQNIVPFKKSWFYHDTFTDKNTESDIQYLKSFEDKYKIQLWKLSINDRIFNSYNRFYQFSNSEILRILTLECKLYEEILDEVQPDYVLMGQPQLRHDQLFYELVRAKKIKTIITNPANLGYKCYLSQESNKFDESDNINLEPNKNKTFSDLQEYINSHSFKKQTEDFLNSVNSSSLERLKAAKEFLLVSENDNVKSHYTYFGRSKKNVLFDSIELSRKRKKRKSFIDKKFETKIEDEPFVYFPMGSDPEASTLLAAPLQNNQVEIIKQIAKSIPIEYKLYVKEHPFQEQRNWRDIINYEEIMEIPNVKLLHPTVKINEIYKKCSLVVTVAGTAGFEAAFYGKPSIIFSKNLNYSIMPSVFQVGQIDDLPTLIRTSLKTKVEFSDVNKFVSLIENNSFDFDFYSFVTKKEQYFFFSGFLIDTVIPISKMEVFLDNIKNEFKILVNEHIKKINNVN